MPKRTSSARSNQILLRVTDNEQELLEALAYLHRKTVNAYVYELVSVHLIASSSDPSALAVLKTRQAFDDARSHVTPLGPRAGQSEAGAAKSLGRQ